MAFLLAPALALTALLLTRAARQPVHPPQSIENSASNTVFGVGLQQDSPVRVKPVDGFDEPDHSVTNQVIQFHCKAQPVPYALGHQAHLRHVQQEHLLAVAALRRGRQLVPGPLLQRWRRGLQTAVWLKVRLGFGIVAPTKRVRDCQICAHRTSK